MVFTKEEEDILRLIIEELKTRKKLDAKRKKKDTDIRDTINPLISQINANHAVAIGSLQDNYNNAEKAIEDYFK